MKPATVRGDSRSYPVGARWQPPSASLCPRLRETAAAIVPYGAVDSRALLAIFSHRTVTSPSARLYAVALALLPLLAPAALLAQTPPAGRKPAPKDTLTSAEREQVRRSGREARNLVRGRQTGDTATRQARADAASATAFGSDEARAILLKAREARIRQDSALLAYRATTTQRISVGLGVKRVGLEKLLFRGDNVSKIAWKRGVGVWVTPVGSRMTIPMASKVDGDMVDAVSIPYFPGKETLWFPSSNFGVAKTDIDEREMIHPIARGAEAYYRYETGDSVDIKLDGGRVIRLRELKITARRPEWRLFVGSFWFDRDGGQLVRAAYRLAVDIDIWGLANEEVAKSAVEDREIARVRDSLARANLPAETYVKDSTQRARNAARNGSNSDDAPPGWVTASFRPAKAKLDAISVEYGLYAGRFWLPRQNSATASAQVGFLRTPVQIDEKFTYEEVNGDFSLPALPAPRSQAALTDSARRDSVDRAAQSQVTVSMGGGGNKRDSTARAARRDSLLDARTGNTRKTQCATDSTYTRVSTRYNGSLRVAYQMPCDETKLTQSAALPPAYKADDELFDTRSRDELLAALDLSLQPAFSPMPINVRSGLDLLRYNRIEGLSVGVQATQTLGAGYSWRALARLGLVDLNPNAEVALSRSNGPRTVTATVYHRLAATNPEWAGALSLGPSLPALLYGRDEGFYYRTLGAELSEAREFRHGSLEYLVFIERQTNAGDSSVVNTFSLARAFANSRFRENIISEPASITGVAASWLRAFGTDPRGFRLTTATRVEAGTGTFEYAKGSFEGTATKVVGKVAAALTGSLGSSAGRLPVQRLWYMGGLRTVRGQIPGTQAGNTFWLTRAELGTAGGAFRPVAFFDVGWAGSRTTLGKTQPQRGAGIGLGILDGLIRLDIARGIYPTKKWRTDLYFESPI